MKFTLYFSTNKESIITTSFPTTKQTATMVRFNPRQSLMSGILNLPYSYGRGLWKRCPNRLVCGCEWWYSWIEIRRRSIFWMAAAIACCMHGDIRIDTIYSAFLPINTFIRKFYQSIHQFPSTDQNHGHAYTASGSLCCGVLSIIFQFISPSLYFSIS